MTKRGADAVLSRGFGFVELSDRDTATAVLRKLQGSALDSHKLELQISATKAPRATTAKVRVRAAASQLLCRAQVCERVGVLHRSPRARA